MMLLQRNRLFRVLALFVVLSLGDAWHAQACEVVGWPRSNAEAGVYVPQFSNEKKITRIGSFETRGKYSGILIQSVAFDDVKCRWVAALSITRKPESVVFISFPDKAPFKSAEASELVEHFSHPQDLSISGSGENRYFWLPSKSRKEISMFRIARDGGVVQDRNFIISNKPIRGLFSAVSKSGENLIVVGAVGKGKDKRQVVKVYDLLGESAQRAGIDLRSISPAHQWMLDESQQESRQWVQGLATYGDSVFVLTGDARKAQTKLLATYNLSGGLEKLDMLPDASSGVLVSGRIRTYEPEGLEVIATVDGLALAFGMAGGTKGKRTYDLWAVPLMRN